MSFRNADLTMTDNLISILFDSSQLSPKTKITLSRTAVENSLLLLEWILEHLTLLSLSSYYPLKSFLNHALARKDEVAEKCATHILGTISFCDDSYVESQLEKELITSLQSNCVIDEKSLNKCYTNAGFFGNNRLIQTLLNKDLKPQPRIFQKAKYDYLQAITSGKEKPKHLETCQIIVDHELRAVLTDIKQIIAKHEFVLNGGGDNSTTEIGHPITTHAATVYKSATNALKSTQPLTTTYYQLAVEMIGELRAPDKLSFSFLGMLTSRGERDKSTSELYEKLIKRITEGLEHLKEYTDILTEKDKMFEMTLR